MEVRSIQVVILLGCFIVSNAFIESLFGIEGLSKNVPDLLCAARYCASESQACYGDSDCVNSIRCMTGCGFSNMTCINRCMDEYEDPVFNKLVKCLHDDHKCLTIHPDVPNFKCNPPKQNVQNFNMALLQGTWWVVRGLNPHTDCYNCQRSNYNPIFGSSNYTLDTKFDVTMDDGSVKHRVEHHQVKQDVGGALDFTRVFVGLTMYEKWQVLDTKFDVTMDDGSVKHRVEHHQVKQDVGGALDFTKVFVGLTMYEKWQVLEYSTSGNYMIVYYCVHITDTWSYEGSLVYSRTPTLTADEITAIADSLQSSMGRSINDYCTPNTVNCSV